MTGIAKLTPVTDLRLDPNNPRLPVGKRGMEQTDLVEYYYFHAGVEELVDSMVANSFFQHEALIANAEADKAESSHVVWEGNRRLAALKIINRDECPENIPDPFLGKILPDGLKEVPVVFVESYAEVKTYIGFRHISGLKTWPPEAKARFVTEAVDEAIEKGVEDPFKVVGKAIGSNSMGVRSYFLAEKSLQIAEGAGASSAVVRTDRFAVWQRLWSSGGFREYLGMPESRNITDLISVLEGLPQDKLKEAVNDLGSKTDTGRMLIPDSRDLDRYGKVLANAQARDVFRETQDLALAAEIIEVDILSDRFLMTLKRLRTLKTEVDGADPKDLMTPEIERLAKLVRSEAISIHAQVEAAGE